MPIIKKEIIIAILEKDALYWKASMQLKVEFLQHWSSRLSKPKKFTPNIFAQKVQKVQKKSPNPTHFSLTERFKMLQNRNAMLYIAVY